MLSEVRRSPRLWLALSLVGVYVALATALLAEIKVAWLFSSPGVFALVTVACLVVPMRLLDINRQNHPATRAMLLTLGLTAMLAFPRAMGMSMRLGAGKEAWTDLFGWTRFYWSGFFELTIFVFACLLFSCGYFVMRDEDVPGVLWSLIAPALWLAEYGFLYVDKTKEESVAMLVIAAATALGALAWSSLP
jgi:hypothetical protein